MWLPNYTNVNEKDFISISNYFELVDYTYPQGAMLRIEWIHRMDQMLAKSE